MTLVACNLTFIHPLSAAQDDRTGPRKQKSLIDYEKKPLDEKQIAQPRSTGEDSDDEIPDFFFMHKESFTLRAGGAFDFKELNKSNGDKDIVMILGMKYMKASENSKHQEYGVDLLSGDNSRLYINGGYKYIVDHTDNLRPYYKIGAALRFDEGDHMETPFDFKSYSIVGSVGLEDTIKDPNSLRMDLDVFWGRKDFLAMVTCGWSYAF